MSEQNIHDLLSTIPHLSQVPMAEPLVDRKVFLNTAELNST